MRVAALYDIHGNLPALEVVLHEIHQKELDGIVVGGDVVAGPMPTETLTYLQALNIPTYYIRGNAESELLRYLAGKEPGGLSERANEEARWLAQTLTSDHIQFISKWSPTVLLEIAGLGQVLFCHATPHSDVAVFTRKTPTEKLIPLFNNLGVSLVVCGHTHMQFDRQVGDVRVVNAGSVGLPFGRTGADWLLLETNVSFRHSDYNFAEAADRIRLSPYPRAESFATNNVLQSPSEAMALEMLWQLEKNQAQKGKL